MSNSLSLDVSLEGYRDIDKTEASFRALLKTMDAAGERSDKLLQSYQTLANTISKDYVNAVGKLAAAEGRLVSTTKNGNSEEAKRVKLINSTINTMRELTVMSKELMRTSEEQLRLQARADNVTARQNNEITKLSNRYAELNTSQATQIARLKEQNRLREESLKSEAKAHLMARRQTQQVREYEQALKELRTAKALEIATLKEQQKAQQQVNASVAKARAGTDRYSAAARRTAEDLKYYASSQGEAALRDQARLKGIKQLVTEEANRSQQTDRMARELERLKNGEEAARYALEARLRAAREAAKAEAELALSTGRSSSSSREATTQLQRHQLELRRLKETSEFYQTAQGREILQVQRRIQAEKRLQQVMADTHINNRLLAQSYSLLTGRSWAAGQATAGMRATLAGLNTSFGMYTSSTILFATAMYTLSRSLRTAITTGAEFEAQMDRVTAVMDATGGMAQFMSREVRDIARVTIFTATEVSEGLMQLGMAGLNTNNAMIALEPSLRLASIGMLDMGRTADIVTNIMVGMNLQMDHLPDVVDDMATAITNSNMTIEQLGNAMSYVAPLTRDADISVQEIIGTLEVLHNTGIKASRAGTAMRTSILALMAPTAKATNVLERYNIRVDDHTGRMRNWTELLGDLAEANLNLADVENLVGKRQAAAFKAMIDSMRVTEQVRIGTDEYGEAIYRQNTRLRESTARLRENAGAAQVMQAVMEDNLRGDWLKLVSAVQDKFLEFYDSNSSGMRDAVQSITEFVKELDVDRIDAFFSSAVKWLERLVPLMIGLKTGQLGHSMTSGVAGALAMIPHPAARGASMVLGAGSVAVGAYTGYLGYSAAADGFDFARSAASPDGLNNLDRRTGAYRHTAGKSSNELIQMYHHHERGLEILAMQLSELRAEEGRFVVEGRLDEYERQVNSINASVETMTENWQRLNEVMVHNNLAATDEIAENMLSGIDSRLAELEAIRVRLATTGRMAQREHLTGYGDVYRVEQFGTVNEESISDWIESSISAKRASWFSAVGDEQRETHAQALRDYIRTTIEAVDPSETGVDEFMSSIRQRIEDSPGASFVRVSDQERLFAGLRAIYELKVAEARVDTEQNQLLEQRADLVGQLVNGIATAEETQNMLYGQDAAAGIDRVMQTTQEYRDSANELYRLTETSERLRENQTQLLDLERNIAEAYREVSEAMAARESDPEAEVRIAASAMEQARWTEQALELREADLKIRQELIKASEREEDTLRSNVRSLQEQVNLSAASIAASVARMEFDSSRTLHLNDQNRLYEEQVKLQEEYNDLSAITVTDPRSLEYHNQMLTSMQNRIDLLGREIQLNDQSYRQQQAIQALAARDEQERNLQALQQSLGLEAQIARYQAEGYWYTAEARAQRDAEVMAQQEVVKVLRARYTVAQLDSETSAETLRLMEQSITAAEDLLHLTEQRSFYQTAEQIKLENTKRIYESLYNGIQQSTVALLESGFKDTQSFFDSLVGSFKRMLAEMAYEAALKPIVVQTVAAMMPAGAGAEFMATQGIAAGQGIGVAGAAAIGAAAVVGAINHLNDKDDERMRKFTAEYRQQRQSVGTVLGAANEKSDSIINLTEHVLSINEAQFNVSRDMLGALRQIDNGLKIAAALTARELGRSGVDGLLNFESTTDISSAGTGLAHALTLGGFGGLDSLLGTNLIGSLGKSLWSTSKSLQDAGLSFNNQSLADIEQSGLGVQGYQQVKTTKRRFGFKSSSSSANYSQVSGELSNALADVLLSSKEILFDIGTELEMSFESTHGSLSTFLSQLELQSQNLSLKGLEGDALQTEIQNWLSSTTDVWTQQMFGAAGLGGWLEQYQRVGEGLLETGGRIVAESQAWQAMAGRLGLAMTATGVAGVELSQELIEVSGGFETLMTNAQGFFDNYYKDWEKQAALLSETSSAMADLGVAMPASRDEFRALITSLQDGGESSRQLAAGLLALQGPMSELFSYYEGVLNDAAGMQVRLYRLIGKEAEALTMERERELAAMDPLLHNLQEQLWLIEDLTAQQDNYTNSLEAAKNALESFSKSIEDYLAELRGSPKGLSSPEEQFEAAQKDYRAQLALAEAGDQDAMSTITRYSDRYLEAAKLMFASGGQTQDVLTEIETTLGNLPEMLKPEDLIADAIADMSEELQEAINQIGDQSHFKQIEENTRAALTGKSNDLLQHRYEDLTKQFEAGNASLYPNAVAERERQLEQVANRMKAVQQEINSVSSLSDTKKIPRLMAEMQELNAAFRKLQGSRPEDFITPASQQALADLYTQIEDLAVNLWNMGVDVKLPEKPSYFAKGGVFTNSVVDTPTAFNMGVMGEAGPEAIMPLHRGPDGSLGVKADVSSSNVDQHVQMVTVLYEIRSEIRSSSDKLDKRLQRLEEHASASVRVQQHGFKGQISAQQEANKELKRQTTASRLEGTK